MPEFSRISMIDALRTIPEPAYLAAKRYQLDDRKPYAYRTGDYGKTWVKITNGIPGGMILCTSYGKIRSALVCFMRARNMEFMSLSTMARIGNRCA